MFIIDQGTNEDDSKSNPHPEAGLLTSGREDRHDMATGVQRESAAGQDTCKINLCAKKIFKQKKIETNLELNCRAQCLEYIEVNEKAIVLWLKKLLKPHSMWTWRKRCLDKSSGAKWLAMAKQEKTCFQNCCSYRVEKCKYELTEPWMEQFLVFRIETWDIRQEKRGSNILFYPAKLLS